MDNSIETQITNPDQLPLADLPLQNLVPQGEVFQSPSPEQISPSDLQGDTSGPAGDVIFVHDSIEASKVNDEELIFPVPLILDQKRAFEVQAELAFRQRINEQRMFRCLSLPLPENKSRVKVVSREVVSREVVSREVVQAERVFALPASSLQVPVETNLVEISPKTVQIEEADLIKASYNQGEQYCN